MASSIDRLLSSAYIEGLGQFSIAELRQRRGECQEVETGLSYFRRLVQGRLDIVHAELARREGGGEASDLQHLIEQLPSILAEHSGGGEARGALPEVVAPTDVEAMSQQLDAVIDAEKLASLPEQSDEDIRDLADRLSDLERTVSGQRRALHERLDALQEEIVRRYKSGEATVDALLS